MRILFVVEASGGGVGRHVLDLASGLAARKHEIHMIYSPMRMDNKFAERVKALSNQGIAFAPYPILRSPYPSDVRAVRFVRSYMRQHGPFDLIHGHSSKGGGVARLAGYPSIPTVYTPHAFVTMDPQHNKMKQMVYSSAESFLGRLSSGIILVSKEEYEHALRLGLPKYKLHIVPNGIDKVRGEERSSLRTRFNIRPEEVVIGFVGRLVKQKAPDILLRAFIQLSKEIRFCRLVYVGSGPLINDLHTLTQANGLQQRVIYLLEQDGEEMMNLFDIFALPSRYEGMPYALLEALSAGLPIVCARVGGVQDLVRDNRNGFTVRPDDHVEFAQSLEKLIFDEETRKRFGQESAKLAHYYSVSRMIDDTLKVYEDILAIGEKAHQYS